MSRMSDAAFDQMLAGKRQAVADVAAEMSAELHRPHGFESRRKFDKVAMALVLVDDAEGKHETDYSWRVSPDGGASQACWVPKSKLTITSRDDRFLVGWMLGWIVIDRKFVQARIPGLTADREWSDDERASWKALRPALQRLRTHFYEEERAKRLPGIKRYRQKLPPLRYGE